MSHPVAVNHGRSIGFWATTLNPSMHHCANAYAVGEMGAGETYFARPEAQFLL